MRITHCAFRHYSLKLLAKSDKGFNLKNQGAEIFIIKIRVWKAEAILEKFFGVGKFNFFW